MTLVNTETGELLDAEQAEQRASYICTDLDFAATSFETAMERMREAIRQRDDMALGYRSPGDYLSDRFGGRLARLGVDLRREVVRELSEAGLSTRAIAPVVGVSFKTVARDIEAPVSPDTPETPVDSSAGDASDSSEAQPKAAPTEEGDTAAAVESPTEDVTATTPEAGTPAPTRPPVVGIDGKSYSRPTPKPPKPVLDGDAAEYANAEQAAKNLSRAIAKLLEFEHPNMRAGMRRYWDMASIEVPPVQRADVTPEQMRVAAHGLLTLADEWNCA